jgi:hypothetical protein
MLTLLPGILRYKSADAADPLRGVKARPVYSCAMTELFAMVKLR